jgi:hypothetical protein
VWSDSRRDFVEQVVKNQDLVPGRIVRLKDGVLRRARNGEDREIVEPQMLRLFLDDDDPERAEQAEEPPGLGCSRSVVVARDHHDDRIGKRFDEAGELGIRVQDGRVRRPYCMKHVAGDHDHVGLDLDDLVDRGLERLRDVGFALIQAAVRLTLILPKAEVEVGKVNQLQRTALAFSVCVILVRTRIGAPVACFTDDSTSITARVSVIHARLRSSRMVPEIQPSSSESA